MCLFLRSLDYVESLDFMKFNYIHRLLILDEPDPLARIVSQDKLVRAGFVLKSVLSSEGPGVEKYVLLVLLT